MAKAKKKQNNLDKYSNWAQYLTITSATLYGVYVVVVNLTNTKNTLTDNVTAALLISTIAGGMLMGLLYLLRLTKKK